MDNPVKLATRRRKTKQKHNTICLGHHYAQTNTHNVNKKWYILANVTTYAYKANCVHISWTKQTCKGDKLW